MKKAQKFLLYTLMFLLVGSGYFIYFYSKYKESPSYLKEKRMKDGTVITNEYGMPAVKNEMVVVLKSGFTKEDAVEIAEMYDAKIKDTKDVNVYIFSFKDLNRDDFISIFEELNNHPELLVVSLHTATK